MGGRTPTLAVLACCWLAAAAAVAVAPDKRTTSAVVPREHRYNEQARRHGSQRTCMLTKNYVSSDWEREWRRSVDAIADNEWTRACKLFTKNLDGYREWMGMYATRNIGELSPADVHSSSAQLETASAIPFFKYTSSCHGRIDRIPIEPLIGALRHPDFPCLPGCRKHCKYSKDYLLIAHAAEVRPRLGKGNRAFFFDLGASVYNSGGGGASQKWFVKAYRQRGIEFSRIFAWEANPIPPADIYRDVPPEIVTALSYFNVPANPSQGAAHNPFRIMSEVAKPADFVVVKLDIDTAPVELAFIKQILEDRNTSDLIDELFFEHHVMRSPLAATWQRSMVLDANTLGFDYSPYYSPKNRSIPGLQQHIVRGDNDITASYELFNILRERGIRAHSWV